jgi:alpha-amylase
MVHLITATLVLAVCAHVVVRSALSDPGSLGSKWHGRSVYFVVTDRFARDDGSTSFCGNGTKEWCGGTLKGVTGQLDYIAGMGFDALWVSPVVEQVPWKDHWNGTAYHGYWARDFFKIDPHFGTAEDLRALSTACKQRQMLLMLDVVANHVGPVHSIAELSQLGPHLSSPSGQQFHTLDRQPSQSLGTYISCSDYPRCTTPVEMMSAGKPPFGSGGCFPLYNFGSGCNHTVILDGWFGDLADLNQEHPPTSRYLLSWIRGMVRNYSLDGLRLDTALYMPRSFLQHFQQSAGVYIAAEVVTLNHTLHRSFTPTLSGLLNFPLSLRFRGGEVWGHAGDGQRGSLQMLATELETQVRCPLRPFRRPF